jgi:hypothetical protein
MSGAVAVPTYGPLTLILVAAWLPPALLYGHYRRWRLPRAFVVCAAALAAVLTGAFYLDITAFLGGVRDGWFSEADGWELARHTLRYYQPALLYAASLSSLLTGLFWLLHTPRKPPGGPDPVETKWPDSKRFGVFKS